MRGTPITKSLGSMKRYTDRGAHDHARRSNHKAAGASLDWRCGIPALPPAAQPWHAARTSHARTPASGWLRRGEGRRQCDAAACKRFAHCGRLSRLAATCCQLPAAQQAAPAAASSWLLPYTVPSWPPSSSSSRCRPTPMVGCRAGGQRRCVGRRSGTAAGVVRQPPSPPVQQPPASACHPRQPAAQCSRPPRQAQGSGASPPPSACRRGSRTCRRLQSSRAAAGGRRRRVGRRRSEVRSALRGAAPCIRAAWRRGGSSRQEHRAAGKRKRRH